MAQVQPIHRETMRLMLGGDVMLGRGVGGYIERRGPNYPLGAIASMMREADLTVINLECAITSSRHHWPGEPKAFYFGAPPQAVQTLVDAGVDMVSLANNHVLDFGEEGLRETCDLLMQHGIRYGGAGLDSQEAHLPKLIECSGTRFGMAAFCDHQGDFAAQANRAGIAYIDLDDEHAVIAAWRDALAYLQRAAVDWPILSLHWGPNMAFRPSARFRRLAHVAIDMGWKILFGHSAHVFQGLEMYRGCPIIYAAGDLVDDYYVDPQYRNDHQLLFELELSHDSLLRIFFHPVFIQYCRVRPATGAQFAHIVEWMTRMCDELGTRVRQRDAVVWIECTDSGTAG